MTPGDSELSMDAVADMPVKGATPTAREPVVTPSSPTGTLFTSSGDGGSQVEDEGVELKRLLRMVRRRKWILILLALLMPGLAYLYSSVFNRPGIAERIPPYLRAQTEYEVNMTFREPTPYNVTELDLKGARLNQLFEDPSKVATILEQEQFTNTLLSMLKRRLERKKAEGGLTKADEAAVRYAESGGKKPSVAFLARQYGEAVRVTMAAEKPEILRSLAQLIEETLNQTVEDMFEALFADADSRLAEKRAALARQLDENRSALLEISQQLVNLDVGPQPRMERHEQRLREKRDLEDKIEIMRRELEALQQRLNWPALKRQFSLASTEDIPVAMVAGSPMRAKLANLEEKLREELKVYTANAPEIQYLRRDIENQKAILRAEGGVTSLGKVPEIPNALEERNLKKIYDAAERIRQAQVQLEAVRALVEESQKEFEAAKRRYFEAKKATNEERQRLQTTKTELEEAIRIKLQEMARITEDQANVDDARANYHKRKEQSIFRQLNKESAVPVQTLPRTRLNIMIALVVGVALGLGLIYLLESSDTRLHTPNDLTYHMHLPYIGVVPKWREQEPLIDSLKPNAAISEVFAHLCNNVLFSGTSSPEKRLLVASAIRNEGKSTIATNMSVRYALEGNTVVLVDADVRRGQSSKLMTNLGLEEGERRGLTEYLHGSHSLDEVLVPSTIPNLFFMPAGNRVENPVRLLREKRFLQLAEALEQRADVVIYDCPAVLPVVDSTILAPLMRGVVLVVAAEHTSIGEAQLALYRLRHVGAPILGGVLNKVSVSAGGYSYYGYRRGTQYYYGYSDNLYGESS